MRPSHGAGTGEDHQTARSATTTEPPTTMDPNPALDEAIADLGHHESWGNTMGKKQPNSMRIVFQNVGGLIPTTDSDLKLTILQQFIQHHNINVFSFAEHNKCWDLVPKKLQLPERTKGWWENAQWSVGYNKHETEPSEHQPGGTGILVVNEFSHRALSPGTDELGMGRWSWIRLRGKAGHVLQIIAAYRPCVSSGPMSTHQQQVQYLVRTDQTDLPKNSFSKTYSRP